MTYEFTITCALPVPGAVSETCLDALYEAGCDDALAGIGQAGLVALDFTREAPDAVAAVRSAIADIMRAIPGVAIIEVSPDLVGMTDIARLLGCSRQNIRKYVMSGSGFPKPIHAGESMMLWHLIDVLNWAQGVAQYRDKLGRMAMDLAAIACKANLELQQQRERKASSHVFGKRVGRILPPREHIVREGGRS